MMKENDIRPDDSMKGQAERLAADVARLLRHKNEFVPVACPACGAEDTRACYQKYGIEFVGCRRCATIYASPRPKPEHLDEYYRHSENYAYWNKHIFPPSESARREHIFKPRVAKVLDICAKHGVVRGTILEVGAGFGIFCEEMVRANFFHRVIGIEPTPDLAETCRRRGLEIIEKPVEQVELGQGTVDVVANFEVIEHLFAPRAFLEQCRDLLTAGGVFITTCPNGLGFDIAAMGPLSSAVDNEHLNLFNPDSLAGLLESCGFEVIEKQTPGQLDAELVRKQALAGAFDLSAQPLLKRILLDEWDRLGGAFQRFLSDNQLSSNMLLVAKKR